MIKILLFILMSTQAMAQGDGTGNVTNICQPTLKVSVNRCTSKVVYKTKYKTKFKTKYIHKVKFIYKKQKKNRFKLFLGYGDGNVKINTRKNTVLIKKEPFLGVGYQRNISERYSLEVNYLFNDNIMVGIGFGF